MILTRLNRHGFFLFVIFLLEVNPVICEEQNPLLKLDPVLNELVALFEKNPDQIHSPTLKKNGNRMILNVFIQTTDISELKSKGIRVRSEIGDVVTAALTLDQLRMAAALASVIRIEAASRCRPALDVSIHEIGADSVWAGYSGMPRQGEGVLIGIYDSGIDWSHPDFIDDMGESRILFLWDQTDDTDTGTTSFGYGTEYTQAQINDEIDGSSVGLVQGRDITGHGTHVAGIAAGNGRGTGNDQPAETYIGVAPKADLIVVKGGNEFFNSDSVVDGLNYIFQKAEAFDPSRPVVVNLSVGGTHNGPHDGTSLYERNLNNLLNENGRSIVVAAGNEGDDPIHFKGEMYSTVWDSVVIEFEVQTNDIEGKNDLYFDIWYTSAMGLKLIIEMPDQTRLDTVDAGETLFWPQNGMPMIYIRNDDIDAVHANGDKEIYIHLSDTQNGGVIQNFETGTWKLIFVGKWGRFDGWMYDKTVTARITQGVDYSTLIAEPGNAHRVITVGSYTSRINWPSLSQNPWGPGGITAGELSSLSSPGPTRPNSAQSNPPNKPEITAPGEYILSSLSDQLPWPGNQYVATDSVHWALHGTSMAAPHVTGAVALLFEAFPDTSLSIIKNWIISSAKRDGYTGHANESYYWDDHWGYGKLDVYQAVLQTDVEENERGSVPEKFVLLQNYPNPFNQATVIQFDVSGEIRWLSEKIKIGIYNLQGREVRTIKKEVRAPGQYRVEWSGLDSKDRICPSGIYIYRLEVGSSLFSRKMILLR